MKKIILSDDIIKSLIVDYSNGISIPKLSLNYGINTRKVSDILKQNNIEIRGRRKFFYDENFFESIDNKIKAYWLGFVFADGCVRNIKGAFVLRIKLSLLDEIHLHNFSRHIGGDGLELKYEKSKFKGKNQKEYESECKTLYINSKKIVKDLINLGCVQNKTKKMIFPNINQDLIPSFILGYFDGDGCITAKKVKNKKYNSLTFTSGSELFLDSIKTELIKYGLASVSKYDYNSFYRLQISNRDDLLKIKDYFYDNNDFYLDRKKIKFDSI